MARGVIDLFLAMVLMLALVALVTSLVAAVNGWIYQGFGMPVVDLNLMFSSLQGGVNANNLWVHLMMFSTLLPTLLHMGTVSFVTLGYPIFKADARRMLAQNTGVSASDTPTLLDGRRKAFMHYVLATGVIPLVIPALLIGILIAALYAHHSYLGCSLLEWASLFAGWIDPTFTGLADGCY